jgi:hypothetical protein
MIYIVTNTGKINQEYYNKDSCFIDYYMDKKELPVLIFDKLKSENTRYSISNFKNKVIASHKMGNVVVITNYFDTSKEYFKELFSETGILKEVPFDGNDILIKAVLNDKNIKTICPDISKDTIGNYILIIGQSNFKEDQMGKEKFKGFIELLKTKLNRFEFQIIEELVNEQNFFEYPARLLEHIYDSAEENSLTKNVTEYILALFGGFNKHDLTDEKIEKLVVRNTNDEIIVYCQKIYFEDKEYMVFIHDRRNPEPFKFSQLSDILKANKSAYEADKEDLKLIGDIDARTGYKLFSYLKSQQDTLNLINISQIEKQYKQLIMDFSRNTVKPLLWTSVMFLFSPVLADIKSIFIQTNDNYLSIVKDIYSYKNNDYRMLHMLNLKALFSEKYFNEFNDKIYTKVFDLARKSR